MSRFSFISYSVQSSQEWRHQAPPNGAVAALEVLRVAFGTEANVDLKLSVVACCLPPMCRHAVPTLVDTERNQVSLKP